MDKAIQFGVIHCHSENSLNDSAMSTDRLCETASKLGATAVTLTDHGVMTGTFEFMASAKKYGIKGVPGVEAYVQEATDVLQRKHLLLLPKNYTGYLAIAKAVTESYDNMIGGFPCMDRELLFRNFGPRSKGYKNVIATTACVGGVLGSILTRNITIEKDVKKLLNRQSTYSSPDDPAYRKNVSLLEDKGMEIQALAEERDALKPIAERPFAAKEKKLSVLEKSGGDEYESAKAALAAEKLETAEAARRLANVKAKLASAKKTETLIRHKVKDSEAEHAKWNGIQEQIDDLNRRKLKPAKLYEEAKTQAARYEKLFGAGNFYIELQFHGLDQEREAMPLLAQIASELNIPVVAANDAHMPTHSEDDILQRQLIRSLRFNSWEERTPDFPEYYIKTDAELIASLETVVGRETAEQALRNVGVILDQCSVEFPKGLHFPKFRSNEDTKARLRKLCEDGIPVRYPNGGWTAEHQKRLDYELEIIDRQGYTDYLCIVQDYIREGKAKGKDNPEHVGMGVGIGRGSAAGSLACYLCGITGVDPIKYDLLFERFLNAERVSSPDIDVDFGKEIRGVILDYVKSIYGEDAVCNIVTKGTFAGKSAIRAAARVIGDREDAKEYYLKRGDEIARLIPSVPNARIEDADLSRYDHDAEALEIISDAKLIQGVMSNYGTHACGVIIADIPNVSDYIPLMRVKQKGTDQMMWDTQCTCVEAEKNAGLLKFDFLGLRNLDIITDTLRTIKRTKGVTLDMEAVGSSLKGGRVTPYDLPIKKNVFDDIFAKGRTTAVFQFESAGMKKMLKQFGPSNIEDVILLVAAFRPGPLQYLEGITDVKKGRKKPSYITPALAPILDKTYGYPIYQEQIMTIFNKVAGFTLGQADEVRRAMGKKHIEILTDPKTNFKGKFIQGLVQAGASEESAEEFWTQLLDFASYAFNKSHAAAYAFVAYYTAWLKLYYPVEYMRAVLNYTRLDKLPAMINECKQMGITILPPDINKSGEGFEIVDGSIIFGLSNIKGVANGAAAIIQERQKGPFLDFKDFVKRCPVDKGSVEALIYAGAMDSWAPKRVPMVDAFAVMSDDYRKWQDKLQDIAEYEEKLLSQIRKHDPSIQELPGDLTELIAEKVVKKGDVSRYLLAVSKKQSLYEKFRDDLIPMENFESNEFRLDKEKELLGMYVSGHPLMEYDRYDAIRSCPICDVEASQKETRTLCGRIEDLRFSRRKADDKTMAFFKLTDETGSIDACVFTKAFEEYEELIYPGAYVACKGQVGEEKEWGNEEDDEAEIVKKLYVSEIRKLNKKKKTVLLSLPLYAEDWMEGVRDVVKANYIGNDYCLKILSVITGDIKDVSFAVRKEILDAKIDRVTGIRLMTDGDEK